MELIHSGHITRIEPSRETRTSVVLALGELGTDLSELRVAVDDPLPERVTPLLVGRGGRGRIRQQCVAFVEGTPLRHRGFIGVQDIPELVNVRNGHRLDLSAALANPGNQNSWTGKAVNLPLKASGGTSPYRWSSTALAPGLTLDPATGVVSGTPTRADSRQVTVTVADAAGKTAVTTFFWFVFG